MDKPSVSTGSELRAPRIRVIGVGSSGVRMVSAMHQLDTTIDALAVDTDAQVLEGLPEEQRIHIGSGITRGLSAGGDVELGRQSIEKNSSGIRRRLREVDLLVVTGGLGGGTGSGAIPVVVRLAREAGCLVLCMVSTPFKLEGKKAARAAEDSLKRIRTHADAVIRIPNERLVGSADKEITAEQAFARSHQVTLDGIFSLWRLLSKNGICGLDFASIHTLVRNCDGFCHFASADGSGEDRAGVVADALAGHALLNKGKLLSASAGAVVGLTGGRDLRLNEIEQIMTRLQALLPEEAWVNFGVAVDPAFEGRLSAIVLAVEAWREPLVDGAGRQRTFSYGQRQGELPFESTGKGRFTNLDPTILNHEDLDVPTYIRREIKLPR